MQIAFCKSVYFLYWLRLDKKKN